MRRGGPERPAVRRSPASTTDRAGRPRNRTPFRSREFAYRTKSQLSSTVFHRQGRVLGNRRAGRGIAEQPEDDDRPARLQPHVRRRLVTRNFTCSTVRSRRRSHSDHATGLRRHSENIGARSRWRHACFSTRRLRCLLPRTAPTSSSDPHEFQNVRYSSPSRSALSPPPTQTRTCRQRRSTTGRTGRSPARRAFSIGGASGLFRRDLRRGEAGGTDRRRRRLEVGTRLLAHSALDPRNAFAPVNRA
jgi:hypothetical protein